MNEQHDEHLSVDLLSGYTADLNDIQSEAMYGQMFLTRVIQHPRYKPLDGLFRIALGAAYTAPRRAALVALLVFHYDELLAWGMTDDGFHVSQYLNTAVGNSDDFDPEAYIIGRLAAAYVVTFNPVNTADFYRLPLMVCKTNGIPNGTSLQQQALYLKLHYLAERLIRHDTRDRIQHQTDHVPTGQTGECHWCDDGGHD